MTSALRDVADDLAIMARGITRTELEHQASIGLVTRSRR
jgi:hypothetical protein